MSKAMMDRSFLTKAEFQVDPSVFIHTTSSNDANTVHHGTAAPWPLFHTTNDNRELPDDFVPGPRDIIAGRGKFCYNHAGNKWFKEIIYANIQRYDGAKTKMDKSLVVNDIVDDIREKSPSGGFVKKVKGRKWVVLDDATAREKVGHAIRDALAAAAEGRCPQRKAFSNLRVSKAVMDSQNSILKLFQQAQARSLMDTNALSKTNEANDQTATKTLFAVEEDDDKQESNDEQFMAIEEI